MKQKIKSKSTTFKNIHIVDWDMIDELEPKILSVTQDKKIMKDIIRNFLQANALFNDPSFCPPDLVLKYFHLLQLSVQYLVDENNRLKQVVKNQKTTFSKKEEELHETIKKANTLSQQKAQTQKTIYQCPFCPKAYYTPGFVHKHINRDHQSELKKFTQSAPVKKSKKDKKPKVTTQVLQPSSNAELESIKDEIRAMFDHLDTTIKIDQEQQTTEFKKRFRELERKINARNINEFEASETTTRKMNRTNSLATYSGHSNSSSSSSSSSSTSNSKSGNYSFSGSIDSASKSNNGYYSQDYNDDYSYNGTKSD